MSELKLVEGKAGPSGVIVRSKKEETGVEFLGEFNGEKGEFEGKVHYNDKNLNIEFFGDFKYGKKNGQGILKLENDDLYVGQFVNDRMSGTGEFYFAGSGSIAVGDIFKDGEIRGEGAFYWIGGIKYQGDIFNGLPHGFGKTIKLKILPGFNAC